MHRQMDRYIEDIDKYAPFAFICDHACMHTYILHTHSHSQTWFILKTNWADI